MKIWITGREWGSQHRLWEIEYNTTPQAERLRRQGQRRTQAWVEFAGMPQARMNRIYRIGFWRRAQIAACPDDWLASISTLGPTTVAELRRYIPYRGAIREPSDPYAPVPGC